MFNQQGRNPTKNHVTRDTCEISPGKAQFTLNIADKKGMNCRTVSITYGFVNNITIPVPLLPVLLIDEFRN